MSILSEIFNHNRSFVQSKEYEAFLTDQFPNKKLVVLTCMDTRLVELLPRAMGFRNGDVKLVKNAGAIVSHPFGSVMRSILLAIYELNGDTLRVCYDLTGKARPSEFKTRKGELLFLATYKRTKS